MKLVENYKEISPLLMKYFKKGLMTNNFLSEAQYKSAIKSKALQFYEWDDGIIFLNAKESFSKLTYELLSLNSKLNVKLPEKTIIEIVKRTNDVAYGDVLNYWKNNGFNIVLNRIRLVNENSKNILTSESLCGDTKILLCVIEDLDGVERILKDNFNKYTGCLPSEDELKEIVKNQFVIGAFIDKELVGMLHFDIKRGYSEIRHLAVNEKFRNIGIAGYLISYYHKNFAQNKSYVWCAAGNSSAKRVYKKYNYKEDGWTSIVLANFEI